MELVKIIEMLEHFNPRFVVKNEHHINIQTHKMLKSNQTDFFTQCIYVGYVSELSDFKNIHITTTLICIEDQDVDSTFYSNEFLNLILMDKSVNQFDVLNAIADIMIDEAALVSDMKLLLDALYTNNGLQYLTDVASDVFGNPIFINDIAYKILAMSQSTVFNDITLENEKTLGYIHEENFNSMRKDNIFRKLSEMDKPLYSKKSPNDSGWLLRSIRIHGIEVGIVAMVENNRPFRKTDPELLESFTNLVAIEIEKSDFYKNNKGIMYNYFLADILSNKIQNARAVSQRLSYLQWKIKDNIQIFLIKGQEVEYFERKADRIGESIRKIIPDCRWTVYQENIVFFFNRNNSILLTENERNMLELYLVQNKLQGGFSNVFKNILDTPRHFRQAMNAAETGYIISHRPGFFYFSDLMIDHIANVLSNSFDLQDFYNPAVTFLINYDKENNSALLETLKQHLYHLNDPVTASKKLNIHRNTLQYRVNKIKELTDINLADENERLSIQVYLKFLDFLSTKQ